MFLAGVEMLLKKCLTILADFLLDYSLERIIFLKVVSGSRAERII